jgi:multiple sugar transport system ATP-binding protein
MKDGFVQQVDTPQNLYDHPTNLFVAGFIGSPQMNFFSVKLEKLADGVYAVFGDNKIKVPEEKLQKFTSDSYLGKEVYMGIRPENLSDDEEDLAKNPDCVIDALVEVTELMGSETYLYLKTSGKDNNIIARVDPRSKSRTGDKIKIALDPSRLQFFDKDTEDTILER